MMVRSLRATIAVLSRAVCAACRWEVAERSVEAYYPDPVRSITMMTTMLWTGAVT